MPKPNQVCKENSNFEGPHENFIDYKGIHFYDKDAHFIDNKTGAHFDYIDLCNQLTRINQERNGLDTSTSYNPETRSVSSETVYKNPLPEFKAHANYKIEKISKPQKRKDSPKRIIPTLQSNEDVTVKSKNILVKLCKPKHLPVNQCTTNINRIVTEISKRNTIDTHSKKSLSPKNQLKPDFLKLGIGDFNFKSMDNRKSIDPLPFPCKSQCTNTRGIFSPKKPQSQKKPTITRSGDYNLSHHPHK